MIISDHLGTDVSSFCFVLVPLRRFAELQSCALLKFLRGDLTAFSVPASLPRNFCNLQLIRRSWLGSKINHKSRKNAFRRCCLRVTGKFIGFAVPSNDFLSLTKLSHLSAEKLNDHKLLRTNYNPSNNLLIPSPERRTWEAWRVNKETLRFFMHDCDYHLLVFHDSGATSCRKGCLRLDLKGDDNCREIK